jgi:hypothetical protein
MEFCNPTPKDKRKVTGLIVVAILVVVISTCIFTTPTKSTPPISGETISFGASSDVGTSDVDILDAALGDLDNDGDLDMVAVKASTDSYELVAWENDGTPFSGSWTMHGLGAMATDVYAVALGDLDEDGDLDIVVGRGQGDPGTHEIIACRNDGTPWENIWYQRGIGVTNKNVYDVAIGDLDNDGDLDIISGNDYKEFGSEILVWENDGTPWNNVWASNDAGDTADQVNSLAVADLEKDGDLDIVSGTNHEGAFMEVMAWRNDGTPFSDPWLSKEIGMSACSVNTISVGDLDGDGDVDIISGHERREPDLYYEIVAWRNNGNPFSTTWGEKGIKSIPDSVNTIELGDLDGDGDLDAAVGINSSGDYEVLALQNPTEAFTDTWNLTEIGTSTDHVHGVALGDLDHDGDLDLVSGSGDGEDYEAIAWKNTQVHRNMPFNPSGFDVGTHQTVKAITLADLDQDGLLDIISGSTSGLTNELMAWQNNGDPFSSLWTATNIGNSSGDTQAIVTGDLDLDGDLDIVSGHLSQPYEILIWENNGTPFTTAWTEHDLGNSSEGIYALAIGDLNNDGYPDIVSGDAIGILTVWLNDHTPHDGVWTGNGAKALSALINSVAVGDLDHDGYLDIVAGTGTEATYEVSVLQNDKGPFTGTWLSQGVGETSGYVQSVNFGDLDHDGFLDIVASCSNPVNYEIVAWRNDGTPFDSTWPQNNVGTSESAYASTLGDLDLDGDLDIVSGHFKNAAYEVVTWENDGTPFAGTWISNSVGVLSESVYAIALGDLDVDGDLDIATGSGGATENYEVVIWKNIGGSAGISAADTAHVSMTDLEQNDVMRVKVAHNGVPGDNNLELAQWQVGFLKLNSSPMTSNEANNLINQIAIYRSSDDSWGVSDTLVTSLDTLTLVDGCQTIDFSDGDTNVQVPFGADITYFIVLEITPNGSAQTPNQFQVTFDPTGGCVIEDRTEDTSVSIQDTLPVKTKAITIEPLPATATPTSTATGQPTSTATATPTPTGSVVVSSPTPTATTTGTTGGGKLFLPLVVK